MKFGINKKELLPALLMLFIGMATVMGSISYKVGTLARMGPGYFPLLVGAALMLVALLIAITPPDSQETAVAFEPQYRAWALVVSAIVLFIVLGRYGGLVPATFTLAFVASLADKKNSLKTALAVAIVLSLMAVAVFHYGLQMQFPLLRWG